MNWILVPRRASSIQLSALTGFTMNLSFTPAALAAPQLFRDQMSATAAMFSAAITQTPMIFNMQVDYNPGSSGASGGPSAANSYSYTQIRNLMIANNKTAEMNTLITAIPSGSSIGGQSSFFLTFGVEKAWGLRSPTDPAQDGGVLMGGSIPTGNMIGAAIHEFGHAMSRSVPYAPYAFTRSTGVGTYDFNGAVHGPTCYFSIDGGVTNLIGWGDTGDLQDFLGTAGNDPVGEFYTGTTTQSITALDIKNLRTMGFQ